MELLKTIKRKSLVSNFLYIALNVLFPFLILLTIRLTGSLLAAVILVILSKWRVFAVRPHYWLANIITNSVDTIVSIGFVIILYSIPEVAPQTLIIQIVLTIIYIVWLLFVKPKSSLLFVRLQAEIAIFVGASALFMVSYEWPAFVVVAIIWIMGYLAAYHVISNYDDKYLVLISLIYAFFFSEFGWLFYCWANGYGPVIINNFYLSQSSILMLLASVVMFRFYDIIGGNQSGGEDVSEDETKVKIKKDYIVLGICVVLLLIIFLFFSNGNNLSFI